MIKGGGEVEKVGAMNSNGPASGNGSGVVGVGGIYDAVGGIYDEMMKALHERLEPRRNYHDGAVMMDDDGVGNDDEQYFYSRRGGVVAEECQMSIPQVWIDAHEPTCQRRRKSSSYS